MSVTSFLLTKLCVNSTDRFTHKGNLFVAIRNTEQGNEMASYTTDQKVFVIIRQYFQEYSVSVEHSRNAIYGLLYSLKVQNLCDKFSERRESVRKQEADVAAREAIINSPRNVCDIEHNRWALN
jgi:hypothetical protein